MAQDASQSKPKAQQVFPFSAIVGQAELKLALTLCVVDPTIGGVMIMGHRGTAKSTAVRALADMLPEVMTVVGCPYNCNPLNPSPMCTFCNDGHKRTAQQGPVPVVDLPLGATEDRVVGALDIERALVDGVQAFAPGLLARANRGFLYIDEVNLLEDHLVDLLLDVATSGVNVVEREGISVRHPARFVLVGSGNPEEGDLRPQLLDRFGLHARITTITDIPERVEIVRRRRAYDLDPLTFCEHWEKEQVKLSKKIKAAQKLLPTVEILDECLYAAAEICALLAIDGHRGELTLTRAAGALAAYEKRTTAGADDVLRVAVLALRHRLRKDPLETAGDEHRIQRAIEDMRAKKKS